MAISVLGILRNSLKLSVVGVISTLVGVPVGIYVATVLGPSEYGAFSFLSLWLTYAMLIGPGTAGAASREIPVLLGKGERDKALAAQDISISGELIYTILPCIVMVAASLYYSEPLLRTGMLIVTVAYVATRLSNLWMHMNFIREKFNTVAAGNLMAGIVGPLAILLTVHWLRAYALLLGPLLAGLIVWAYNLKKSPVAYHFRLDRGEIIRLTKVGVVLQGLSLIFWAFRLGDRTIIAATLPLEQLGLYAYAMAFLTYALTIFADFGNVLQPIMYREAGKAENIFDGFKDARRVAVYFALGTAIFIPLAQLGFGLLVTLITTKYIDSIPIFYALSYNVYLASMPAVPSLILSSSIVNKQNVTLLFYAIGLALSIMLDLAIIKLGYGVLGVAWVTVGVQGIVTLVLYYFARRYICPNKREFSRFLVAIAAPFAVSILFYFLHLLLASRAPGLLSFAAISLASQVVVWGIVIGLFYRDYISMESIRLVRKEINEALLQIRGRLG